MRRRIASHAIARPPAALSVVGEAAPMLLASIFGRADFARAACAGAVSAARHGGRHRVEH